MYKLYSAVLISYESSLKTAVAPFVEDEFVGEVCPATRACLRDRGDLQLEEEPFIWTAELLFA